MSEGTWKDAKHEDIREGDVVRVTHKDGPQTTITEGKVTNYDPVGTAGGVWCIENFDNFFADEFRNGTDTTLERFEPAFVWPAKLGAVVTGSAHGKTVYMVLVEEVKSAADAVPLWWTKERGIVNMFDVEGLEDLTVVSEGVTVKP